METAINAQRVCLPVLGGRQREARHGIFGAVELLNDSDAGDRVRAFEVNQMGRRSDARRLKQKVGVRGIGSGAARSVTAPRARRILRYLL